MVAGAWIVTGGTRTGVMEIVGEAAREHMLQNGLAEQNIVLLGIVAWSMVANNDKLEVSNSPTSTYFIYLEWNPHFVIKTKLMPWGCMTLGCHWFNALC